MKKIEEIHIFVKEFFKYIIYCFVAACFITLMNIFFDKSEQDITKAVIQNLVWSYFTTLIVIYITFLIASKLWRRYSPDNVAWQKIKYKDYMDNGGYAVKINPLKNEYTDEELEILKIGRIHEAGHAVMAYLQGFKVDNCIASLETGCVNFREAVSIMDKNDYEKIILICYAGAASEKLINGEYKAGCVDIQGKSDFEKAEKYIRNLLWLEGRYGYTTGGECFENKIREKSIEFFDKTYNILSKHQDMISKIIKALERKQSLSGDEIRELL